MCDEKLSPIERDLWRANTYHLLTQLLTRPPNHWLVAQLGEIPPLRPENGGDPVALAWSELGQAARQAQEPIVAKEYQTLFNGGNGSLIPYASWYLTGEIAPAPMSLLRSELVGLGIEQPPSEAIDHAGAVCDIMSQLIEAEDPRQIGFFTRHLKSWLPTFFRDLRLAPAAQFYRSVGFLGEAFLEIERIYLRKIY